MDATGATGAVGAGTEAIIGAIGAIGAGSAGSGSGASSPSSSDVSAFIGRLDSNTNWPGIVGGWSRANSSSSELWDSSISSSGDAVYWRRRSRGVGYGRVSYLFSIIAISIESSNWGCEEVGSGRKPMEDI